MVYGNIPMPPVGSFHNPAVESFSCSTANTETPSTTISYTHSKACHLLASLKQRLNRHCKVVSTPPAPYSIAALNDTKKETREEAEIYFHDSYLMNCIINRGHAPLNLKTHPVAFFPERLQNIRVAQNLFFALRARVKSFFADLNLMPLREGMGENFILLDAIACLKFYERCWVAVVGWEYTKNWMNAVDFLAGQMRREMEGANRALTDGLRARNEILRQERERNAEYGR